MATVVASLVVNFGEDSESDESNILRLEIDRRTEVEGGLNLGKTQFYPGDSVHILRFISDNLSVITQDTTLGSLNNAGSGQIEVDEVLTVSRASEVSLNYPVSSNFSAVWLGNSYSEDGNQTTISRTLFEGRKIIFSQSAIGLLRVRYNSNYQAFRLHSVPLDELQAFVFVIAEIVAPPL